MREKRKWILVNERENYLTKQFLGVKVAVKAM